MARRNIDLEPRSSDPVGLIRRKASASRMAVKHVPIKTEDDSHLRTVDQPFRVVVTKQQHTGRVRWEVAIERGGKLDEGYSYRLPIRHRRSVLQAIGLATTLAIGLACSEFYIELNGDALDVLAVSERLEPFLNVEVSRGYITCHLDPSLLRCTYTESEVEDMFARLMNRTDRSEIM